MLAALNVLKSLNNEPVPLICVGPARLSRSLVIEHVSVGDEAISLNSHHLDSKDATGDHHSHLTVLLERELAIVRHLRANSVVILLNIPDLLADLILKWTALEPSPLLLRIKNGEVVECLWQNIDVLVKDSSLFAALLHHIGCQEGVLW